MDQSGIGIQFDVDANACTSRSADRAVSLRPIIGNHSDSDRDTCRRLDTHACPDTITDCGVDTNACPTANSEPSADVDARPNADRFTNADARPSARADAILHVVGR